MENTFNDVIEAFSTLKAKFQAGEISRQEFIDEMKKLRIRDDQGRFWMIGAQTGKWYYFDGKDWIQAEPPSQMDRKAICVYCGFENKLESDVCARCGGTLGEEPTKCPHCGIPLQKPLMTCPQCGPMPVVPDEPGKSEPVSAAGPGEEKRRDLVLRSVHPASFFKFGGILGIFLGIVLGAFSGVTDLTIPFLSILPKALTSLQGKLLGAVIYGLLGGVFGFIVIGCFAFLKAVVMNLILSLMGGVGFTADSGSVGPAPGGRRGKTTDDEKSEGV
jgi:ribosomal protein L40E